MGLAHVHGADAHGEAAGRCYIDDVVPDLLDQLLLNLKPRGEVVDDAVILGQTR